MKKNLNLKMYSTTFLTSLLIGYVIVGQIESVDRVEGLGLFTVATANSNVRYVRLDNAKSTLNFRKEPNIKSRDTEGGANFLGSLKHGDKVTLISTSIKISDGIKWANVSVNGKSGWVDSSKLSEDNQNVTVGKPLSAPVKKQVSVSVNSYLNVRTNPSVKEGSIIGKLKDGDIVEVTSEAGQWYKMNKGSLTGWVNKAYLRDINKESAYNVINTWSHKDNESDIYIRKVRAYNSDVYIAEVKINSALQFKHVYSDNSSSGEKKTVMEMTKNYSPLLAINANGFSEEGLPCGTIGATGKIDQFVSNKTSLAMDYNGRLHIVKPQTKEELESIKPFWVTTFGPTLIENYKNVQKNSTNTASHPRVAIAQKDRPNEFLIIVADGRSLTSKGLTLTELASLFEKEGARVAYNLDGGGSATLVFKGQIINKPSDLLGPRKVVDALFIRNIK